MPRYVPGANAAWPAPLECRDRRGAAGHRRHFEPRAGPGRCRRLSATHRRIPRGSPRRRCRHQPIDERSIPGRPHRRADERLVPRGTHRGGHAAHRRGLLLVKKARQPDAGAHIDAATALLRAAVDRSSGQAEFARRWRGTVAGLLQAFGAAEIASNLTANGMKWLTLSEAQLRALAAVEMGVTAGDSGGGCWAAERAPTEADASRSARRAQRTAGCRATLRGRPRRRPVVRGSGTPPGPRQAPRWPRCRRRTVASCGRRRRQPSGAVPRDDVPGCHRGASGAL